MTTEQAYWLGFIVGGATGSVGAFILMVYVALKSDRKMRMESRERLREWDNS